MEAPHVYIVRYNGYDVECYGTLEETSNFAVVCEDEEYDDIWMIGDPLTGNPFENWEEVVIKLSKEFDSPILEIEVC